MRKLALGRYEEYLEKQRSHFLGYQAGQSLDYRDDLSWLLEYHVNNIGDPFTTGNFTVNSKLVERSVLDYYATLWNAVLPHDVNNPESYWGYLLTMGSTEGNMYAMWNARDYLGGKALVVDPCDSGVEGVPPRLLLVQAKTPEDDAHAYTPVAFYSEDTHYSFTKAARVVGMSTFYELGSAEYRGQCPLPGSRGTWPTEVPSLGGSDGPGEIDVEALAVLVEFFAERHHPVFISLNCGTTFKGAYDPVETVVDRIVPIMKTHQMFERKVEYAPGQYDVRHGFWIHVDGALGAAYLPFLKMAQDKGRFSGDTRVPVFDFSLPYVFSIAMSGHKWVGAPWPCGVFMTKVRYQLRPPSMPIYVGSPDTTFAGSRNGFSPMVLWNYLAKHSYEDQMELACVAQDLASYTESRLRELGSGIGLDLYVARTPLALTVRFRMPRQEYVTKYSLSTEQFDGDPRMFAHVFLMPGITKARIDEFLADLAMPGAFDVPPATGAANVLAQPQPSGVTADDVLPIAHVPISGRGFH